MCINPGVLADGQPIGCRRCWQCRETQIDNLVGRAIGEARTSSRSASVTLTFSSKYAVDREEADEADSEAGRIVGATDRNLHAQQIFLSDFQNFIRRLRHHHPCRYLMAAERGSKRGRVHFHACLFFADTAPYYEERNSFFVSEYWKHGFSFWDKATPKSLRYVVKYYHKNTEDQSAQGLVRMSKKPALGSAWMALLAGRYVEAGLAPQDASYSFSDVLVYDEKRKTMVPKVFWLHDHSRDRYLLSYLSQWYARYPDRHPPSSPYLEDWHDRYVARTSGTSLDRDDDDPLRIMTSSRPRAHSVKPWFLPDGCLNLEFSEHLNTWQCVVDGKKLFWSFDAVDGSRAWRSVIIPETAANLLLEASVKRKTHESYREERDGSV